MIMSTKFLKILSSPELDNLCNIFDEQLDIECLPKS